MLTLDPSNENKTKQIPERAANVSDCVLWWSPRRCRPEGQHDSTIMAEDRRCPGEAALSDFEPCTLIRDANTA